MSLVYNEELQQLEDSARDFLMTHSPVSEQRRIRDEKISAGFDAQVWQQMLEYGWGGIALPEAYGGLEFGFKGFAPIFEHVGRNLVASPLLTSVVLCGSLLAEVGTEQQRAEWLPRLISGEQRLAFASHAQHHFRVEELHVMVTENASGFVLEGEKLWVPDANHADGLLVAGRFPSGRIGLFLLPADAEGLEIEPMNLLDARNHAQVSLNKVQVPASARIGGDDDVQLSLELAWQRATACVSAELLGVAATMFEMTVDYLKTRTQFGAYIGSFQALQHRAAWMLVELELARSAVMASFEALNKNSAVEERQLLTSLAKWKAGEVAHLVSREAVQMHGGIGVTDEYDLGLYVKRSRVAQVLFGDSDYHCERYGLMAQLMHAQ